ncbi:uncharacterized protein BDZ99DRAFT_511851 [Mytilinidion resinicola]|uniref:HRQ family protein 2 n=1 Tax=Mytilinidion resinicola TaxID=574789 RepID=A0A6A6Y590_9PEZI|nr:uncharacterized protein BDZ99DRAFT_511851 [Mytilinidion resinicola]KAF2803688.1 hypothetical protein BDZ99DRAFT_511851 [Mytilinidion resinicola]
MDIINNPTFAPTKDVYNEIDPLLDFNWRTIEPLQIRPFKPRYHLTMALQNTTMSELVAVDKTYVDRINLRRQLIKDRPNDVLAANPSIVPAVNEFHAWMFGTYLPSRYSSMFKLIPASYPGTSAQLLNCITSETIPISAEDAVLSLRLLGEHIDTDFLFLLPSESPTDQGKYKLEGFITCFPSGFDTPKKLNLKLAEIHAPVPGYGAKIEKSMDRFFATLPTGKIVLRTNWSITTNTNLFSLGGNHLYEGEEAVEEMVNIDETVLRCERQTLHRLPKSQALVFAFRTYQYPIRAVKEEGSGEALADAIDGLSSGSVPGMAVYKRGVVWGRAVKAFLRT